MTGSRPQAWPPHRDGGFSVTLFGCGLIGGSIALALRRRWPSARITGIDRRSALREAQAREMIDAGVPRRHWRRHLAAETPDLVLLALPVDVIVELLPALAHTCQERPEDRRPLVLDVGSVKGPIVALARQLAFPRFVGGHPMAGLERGGAGHATATLFDGRRFVLCPPSNAAPSDRAAARALVSGLGAEPLELEAELHDRCVAMTSHVPHLVALALMGAACRLEDDLPAQARGRDLLWRLAAGSWRDATRVAAADPTLWQSIVTANHAEIARALDLLLEPLERLRDGLRRGADDLLCDDEGGLGAERLARVRRRIDRYLP